MDSIGSLTRQATADAFDQLEEDDVQSSTADAEDPFGDGGGANPFLGSIREQRDYLEQVVEQPEVVKLMADLPTDMPEKVAAIRQLTPRDIAGSTEPHPGLRVAVRWFEHETPMDDSNAERYQMNLYTDGYPPGWKPRPLPEPKPSKISLCGSVGVVVCGSVGG